MPSRTMKCGIILFEELAYYLLIILPTGLSYYLFHFLLIDHFTLEGDIDALKSNFGRYRQAKNTKGQQHNRGKLT